MDVTGLPRGWTAWVSQRTVGLSPGETKTVSYRIDPGSVAADFGARNDVSLVGRLLRGDAGIDPGGLTTAIHFVRATKTGVQFSAPEEALSLEAINDLKITARVNPSTPGAWIALDLTDSRRQSVAIIPARVNSDGTATWVLGDLIARKEMPNLRRGERYTFQADFYGTGSLEASSSAPMSITVL
jgi:hypothetical protein